MQNPSPEHQKLVFSLMSYFKNKLGHTILAAAYTGFNEPDKHGRHEPDIVTKDSQGILHLSEGKVGDDILSETSEEQFWDFSSRVMNGTNIVVPFHIIVYEQDKPILENRLAQIGLNQLIDNGITIWTLP